MAHWRNAIAHQDFTSEAPIRELGGRTEITLAEVRRFRSNCDQLAKAFDEAVLAHLKTVAGPTAEW
jgi:hypothetical protein